MNTDDFDRAFTGGAVLQPALNGMGLSSPCPHGLKARATASAG
jgi:hypothetical protein